MATPLFIFDETTGFYLAPPTDNSVSYESVSHVVLGRRRKVWKIIPPDERCCGLRANGQQCTRRKKEGQDKYCGTHIKGTPHGTI